MNSLLPPSNDLAPILLAAAFVIAVYVVPGIICAVLAAGRGRSAVGWFFIGLVANCIGIVLVLVLPNPKLEEQKRQRQEAETRKLREQLKKERQVADERHDVNRARLGTHDRALGMDTSAAEPQLLGTGAPPPPPPPAAIAEAMWFYALGDQQQGPVPESRLCALRRAGRIEASTLVWRDGMANWTAYGDVPGLAGGEA